MTTPPLARRLAEAGVAPDAINTFCWRCARTIGPFETDAHGCSKCRSTRPPWTRFVRLAEYAPPWDRIVQDAKFTRWPRLSVDLGRLLGRQIAAAVPDLHDRPTVVVPVPTNIWRRLGRGTDHSLNIARGVARELRLPVRTLLTRARRPEQSRLSRTDRATNLRGSMGRARLDALWAATGWTRGAKWPSAAAVWGAESAGSAGTARLIVVDDISTTGATMNEACRAARQVCKSLSTKELEIVAGAICRTEEAR
ncbi:MAG: hypothetical protein Q8L55_10925 [Phycisphaerales bacterium]|nr:hypothetical protein [Phycisphaerales bacterium]